MKIKKIRVNGCAYCSYAHTKTALEVGMSKGILGIIRIIMFGNAAGIAWGSFLNRFGLITTCIIGLL